MIENKILSAKQTFLRYAFSCAHVLLDQKRITAQDYDQIKNAAIKGKEISITELERLFPAATRRLRMVAKEKGKYVWDDDIVRNYFREDHNKFIDAGDGMYGVAPKSFCELCKVKVTEVIDTKIKNEILFLKVADNNRWVVSPFLGDVSIGERVYVHHTYAVERAP